MQLLYAWAASVRYALRFSTWKTLGQGLVRSLPLAIQFVAGLVVVTVVAQLGVPLISPLLSLILSVPPPLIAIVGSPLYVLPLVRLFDETEKHHPWGPYLLSGFIFYSVMGGIVWLAWHAWHCGCQYVVLPTTSFLSVLAPGAIVLLWCSPFVVLAYAYEPMASRGHAAIWRHGGLMAWYELPFICLLLACMMPFGLLVYTLPTWLVDNGMIALQWWRPLLHIGSVVYWLLGWGVFKVYYQARKHEYIERKDEK